MKIEEVTRMYRNRISWLVFNLLVIFALHCFSLDRYVSPAGDDSYNGTIGLPFKTIKRAQDAVRLAKGSGMTENITVFLRDGVYFVSETITFDENDSGEGAFTVTYCRYPNEEPVIVGGEKLEGWTPYSGSPFYFVSTGIARFSALYENGIPGKVIENTSNQSLSTMLSLLNSSGRFYHDDANGYLYYFPRRLPIDNQEIVIPRAKSIIKINGNSMASNQIVRNFTLSGLTLFCSNYIASDPYPSNPERGLLYIENAENVSILGSKILCAGYSGIVVSRYAKNITIDGNRVDMCGGHGITLAGYMPGDGSFSSADESDVNQNNTVSNNYIARCGLNIPGSSGVHVTQSGYNTISNNTIERIRGSGIVMDGRQLIPGSNLYGTYVTQTNYYQFIHSRNNLIKYNSILNLEFTSKTSAGFYTKDAGLENEFNNNIVHDINVASSGIAEPAEAAIYADFPSSNLKILKNIVYANTATDTKFKPVFVRGNDITIDNNVIADNDPVHEFVIDKGYGCGNNITLTRNVTRTRNGIFFYYFENLYSTTFGVYNNNVFYHPDGSYSVRMPQSVLEQGAWRSFYNSDTGSSFGIDPLFTDPESRMYSVSGGSPAVSRGFTGITQTKLGIPATFAHKYATDTIEAEKYNEINGAGIPGPEVTTIVRSSGTGDYLKFEKVVFEPGIISCELRLSCNSPADVLSGRMIEIHLDNSSGFQIGSIELKGTGSASVYTKLEVPVSQAQGTHDIYIVFSGSPVRVQLDYFRFRTVPAPPPTQPTNIPPFVEILEPLENASLPARKDVTIRVNAYDTDGTIDTVQININGLDVGAPSTIPMFDYTWSPGGLGEYTIMVTATDSGKQKGSASRHVTVVEETSPTPVVTITSPADGAVYPKSPVDEIPIRADVKDADGIKRVEFLVNNNLMDTRTEEPYEYLWPNVQGGDYTITVKAYDINEVSGEAAVHILVYSTGNLIGYWEFESGGIDSSGNGKNATVVNGQYVSGAIGSALNLNGSTFATTKESLMNNLRQFTASGWIQPKKIADYAGLWGQSGVVSFGFISASSTTGESLMQIWTNGCGGLELQYPYPVNEWHHVAIVGDGQALRLYFDGVRQPVENAITQSYGASEGSFNIGGGGIWNSTGDFFTGAIDDVRLYNIALSDREIASFAIRNNNKPPVVKIKEPEDLATFEGPLDILIKADAVDEDGNVKSVEFFCNDEPPYVDYQKPYEYEWRGVRPGSYKIQVVATDNELATGVATVSGNVFNRGNPLLGYWPFDEGGGSIAHDSSGNGYDGAISGAEWSPGVKGSGLRFSGNGYVQIAKGFLNNLKTFTLAGWVKPENEGYRIGLWGQDGAIEFGFADPAFINLWTLATESMDTAYPFPINEWHHIAAVGTGDSLLVYLDGKQTGKRDAPTQNYGKSGMPFDIGGKIFDSMGNYIVGMIDEVYVYNKALPPSDIESMARISADTPEVSITKPAEGDAFDAPGDIEITVDAKSKDSRLRAVELYVNKLLFRTDQEEPYSFMLHVEIPGDYELRAKAINEGGYWTEDTVTVRVSSNSNTEGGESATKPKDDGTGKDTSSTVKHNDEQFTSGKHMHSSEYETHVDAVKYAIEQKVQNKSNKKSVALKSDGIGTGVLTKNLQHANTQGSASAASGKGGGSANFPRPSEPPGALTALRFTDVKGSHYAGYAGSTPHPAQGSPLLVIIFGVVFLCLVAGGVVYFVLARQRRNGKSPRMNAHA